MISLIQSKNQPKATFITYYQGFLAIAAILVFFTRVDTYLANHHGFFVPLFWMLGFLVASFPLWISLLSRLEDLSRPLVIWSCFYIAVSLVSILVQPVLPKQQYLENQYRTILFLIMMLGIFAYHPLVTKWTKLAILFVTFMNIGTYLYEFLNPLAFYVEQRAAGRSSGVYEDSNAAGIALVVGMICTIDMIKPKYRLFYALLIFVGIAPTFSRGAIAGWVLVMGFLILKKTIPRYQMPLLVVFFMVTISILSTQLGNLKYLKDPNGKPLFNKDSLARVEFMINPLAQKDDSKAAREEHVEVAWKKFVRHPFLGNGLGSGENIATLSSTGVAQRSHNTYLDQMVEFGFLGVLFFPSLLLVSIWQAKGAFKSQAVAFTIFLLSQGFFSHTLMNEFCSLIFYAVIANLSKHSSEQQSSAISPINKGDNLGERFYFRDSEV
jgi:O-Antigen ligase